MRTCEIEGCNEKYFCKGLCKKHYDKQWHKDNPDYDKEYRKNNKEYYAKYMKQYRIANKELIDKKNKQYYEDHKGHKTKYIKQYYQDHKEYIAIQQKLYRQSQTGRTIMKAGCHNRRALEKGLTLAIIQSVYEANIKKYGTLTCYLCFKPIVFGDKRLKDSLEHSIPLTRGGTNNYENLGIAHLVCNFKKGTMTLIEYNRKQKRRK